MVRVDLFAEDQAHETFVSAIVSKAFRDPAIEYELNVRVALGGHGKALSELKVYQRAILRGDVALTAPDLLIVTIDGNCKGPTAARKEILDLLDSAIAGDIVVACPDPHVEKWFFADPAAFGSVVGANGQLGKRKCQRDFYKDKLREAVIAGGNTPVLDGIEFAADVVEAMDAYQAKQNDPSLGVLLDGLHSFAARHAAT